ncbi:class I SAM-dependent methyltransferase [Nocardioides sp.]|uniref:class I SAM-dependent methyltransferase n=1 Tax=Nocardioides sp. TaxID=35761 RepID=UPI0027331137|nr:class I SAM-dependent methyltransferase [Nocardioides sp.]MDP3889827.1 class I SAM-dependent methyltransferase [Nocardioides sp.]
MGVWSDRVLPRIIDRACAGKEFDPWRRQACSGLTGRVLEIGFGSGLNIDHYPDTVASVAAVEPSDLAWELSGRRRAGSSIRVERSGLDGQELAEADASCDSALSTFTLCTVPDPTRALREVRRVLRPGGALHVLEHGLAPEPDVARWQRRLDPVQKRVAGGCHLTRPATRLLVEAGFDVEVAEEFYLPGPKVMRPWSWCTVAVCRPAR